MSEKNKNIDHTFKAFLQESLGNYSHPVRDDLWSEIENTLHKKKVNKRKAISIWSGVAAVLISIVLLLPSGEKRVSPALSIANRTHPFSEIKGKQKNVEEKISPSNVVVQKKRISQNSTTVKKDNQINVDNERVENDSLIINIPYMDEKNLADSNSEEKTNKFVQDYDAPIPPPFVRRKKQNDVSLALRSVNSITDGNPSVNISEFPDITSGTNKEVKQTIDYDLPVSLGLLIRKNLTTRFAIETGLVYTFLSSKEKIEITNQTTEFHKIKMHYLGIPINGLYTFYSKAQLSVYGSVGGMVEKMIYGTRKIQIGEQSKNQKLDISNLQWSVTGSFGINYEIIKHWSIYFEPGVSYYFDDQSNIETLRKDKPLNFNLQGGLRYSY